MRTESRDKMDNRGSQDIRFILFEALRRTLIFWKGLQVFKLKPMSWLKSFYFSTKPPNAAKNAFLIVHLVTLTTKNSKVFCRKEA